LISMHYDDIYIYVVMYWYVRSDIYV
jgi:hypothetical protein